MDANIFGAILGAGAIILREGFEAILILTAAVAVLRKTGAGGESVRAVYAGAWAAFLFSAAVSVGAASYALSLPERTRAAFEGIVGFVAVVVLFFVINWLFHHTYVVKWNAVVTARAKAAAAGGSILGLFLLGFTVVGREGIETALFLQTIVVSRGVMGTMAGVAIGLGGLIVLASLVLRGVGGASAKTVFKWTTVILIVFAVAVIGGAAHEMQEVGWLSETHFWFRESQALGSYLGVYPSVETFVAQATLVALVIASYVAVRLRVHRASPVSGTKA